MNLKKIGSALTAITMIASMATYVPFSVSAAGHSHDDAKIAANKYEDAIGTYSGTLYGTNVNYSLVVTKNAGVTKTSGLAASEVTGVLTISSPDENYTIPDSDTAGEGFLELIAYGEDKLGVADVIELTDKIAIAGSASSVETNAFVDVANSTGIDVSCLASNEVVTAAKAATSENKVTTTHKYVANAGKKTHTCSDCGTLSKLYNVHEFKAASTTAKEHLCACGMSSEDYISDTDKYNEIHSFNAETHKCTKCGLDDKANHVSEYTRTATTHTIVCKTCKMTLASAEAHTWSVFDGVNKPTDYTGNIQTDVETGKKYITVAVDQKVYANSHYCSVCGYVAGTNKEDARHSYTNIYTSVYSNGNWVKKLTPVVSGGLVCACGDVIDGHTHKFEAKNGKHMCECGEIEANSQCAFNYVFTGTGAYTVNGLAGYNYVTTGGVKCGCGAIDTGHSTNHIESSDILTEDDLKQADSDKSIVVGQNHYCTCGNLIVDGNGDAAHFYAVDVNNNQHVCYCGAVNENEHNYKYVYVVNPVTEAVTEVSGTTVTTVVSYNVTTSVVTDGGGKVVDNGGVVCTCGAIKDSHKKHDFTKSDMCDKIKGIHYCTCGAKSSDESVHNYSDVTNRCTLCDAYIVHDHDVANCVCKICGKEVHDWTIATVKGEKVHQCQACGVTVENSALTIDSDAHTFVAVGDKHICECGLENPDAHKYVEDECKCVLCDYENHTFTFDTDKHTHTCSVCKKVFSKGEYCTSFNENDKCTKCLYLNPMHKHAVKDLSKDAETGKDSCRCGATIAYNWVYVDGTNHKNANVKQTVTTDANGIQKVEDSKNPGDASTLTAVAHSYDANGFCACGFVKQTLLADAKDVETNLVSYATKYSSAYLVKLAKAADAVLAYHTSAGEDMKVAKTAAAQAEFTAALAEFTKVYADMNNNKASAGYQMFSVQVSSGVYGGYVGTEVPSSEAAGVYVIGTVGSDVTLTATAKPGYKFVGWYTSDDADAELFAADATVSPYTLKVNNGVTNVYAKFAKNSTITIKIPANVQVDSAVSGYTNAKKSRATDYDFVLGSEVTLTVEDNASGGAYNSRSEIFFGLVNGWGQLCKLNAQGEYTFTVVSNMSKSFEIEKTEKTTVDGTIEKNEAYIVFKNDAQILAARAIDSTGLNSGKFDATSFAPNDPVKNGYTFKGWAKQEAPNTVVRLKELTGDAVLVPVFAQNPGYKLTIGTGGRLATNDLVLANNGNGFKYGTEVTLTAEPMVKGKYFSGWYVNGKLYTLKKDFAYIVTANATLVPKYEGDSEIVLESMTTLSVTDRVKTASGQSFVANAKWEMTNDVTITDAGLIFSFSGVTGDALKVENADNDKVYKRASSDTSLSGVYDFTFSLSSKSGKDKATVNVKSYVTYTDASGKSHTIYSDEAVVKPVA